MFHLDIFSSPWFTNKSKTLKTHQCLSALFIHSHLPGTMDVDAEIFDRMSGKRLTCWWKEEKIITKVVRIYQLGTLNICCNFHGNWFNRYFTLNHKCQPQGCTKKYVSDLLKSVGFILWQKSTTICPRVAEIFYLGSKWQTDQHDLPTAWLQILINKFQLMLVHLTSWIQCIYIYSIFIKPEI